MDEFNELYERILDNQNWEIDDLDRLVELSKAEGYECGKLSGKQLLRECYNVLTDSTGLDTTLQKPQNESSLLRRVREYINE